MAKGKQLYSNHTDFPFDYSVNPKENRQSATIISLLISLIEDRQECQVVLVFHKGLRRCLTTSTFPESVFPTLLSHKFTLLKKKKSMLTVRVSQKRWCYSWILWTTSAPHPSNLEWILVSIILWNISWRKSVDSIRHSQADHRQHKHLCFSKEFILTLDNYDDFQDFEEE